MPNTLFHFSFGIGVAMLGLLPGLLHAWRSGWPLAGRLARGIAMGFVAGLWAIGPVLLHAVGVGPEWTQDSVMNIFFFTPLLDRLIPHANLLGQAALTAILSLQYFTVLAGIVRARRIGRRAPTSLS